MTREATVGELREAASKVLREIELRDVRLIALQCVGANPVLGGPFEVESDVRVRTVQSPAGAIQTFARYIVAAERKATRESDGTGLELDRAEAGSASPEIETTDADESDDDNPAAWMLTMEVLAEYVHPSGDDSTRFDGHELTAFGLLVGLMNIHPYARETVQTISGRLGYPPFSLKLIESLAEQSPDSVVEITTESLAPIPPPSPC